MRYLTPHTPGTPRAWPTTLSPIQHATGGGGGGGGSLFVTRDAGTGNLMLDGERYRFAGCNAANDIGLVSSSNGHADPGTEVSSYYLTPHTQIDAVLDSAELMNAAVIRTFAAMTFNHPLAIETSLGVFDDANMDALDYVIYQCGLRGIRLILPFLDEVGGHQQAWVNAVLGSGAASLFYTNSTVITAFKAHISHVLDHVNPYTSVALKDDPAILFFETGNELTSLGLSLATYAAWVDAIATHIKTTKGAQQLVLDGTLGTTNDWSTYYTDLLSLTSTDAVSNHCYDDFRTPLRMVMEGANAHTYNKAFILGEYTWTGRKGSNASGAVLPWEVNDMTAAVEGSTGIDGDLYWDQLAPGTVWDDGFTLHRPATGQCVITGVGTLTVADEDNRGTILANHAAVMRAPTIHGGTVVVIGGDFTGTGADVLNGGDFATTGSDVYDGGTL